MIGYTHTQIDGLHTVRTIYGTFTAKTRDDAMHRAQIAERRELQRQELERRNMATRQRHPHLDRRTF